MASAERRKVQPSMPLDSAMITTLGAVGAVAVLLSLGALFASGWSAALGVAIGGLVATVNLWLFAVIAQGVLRGGRKGRLWGLAGGLKFIALLGLAYALLNRGLTSGLTLAIGYGALPLGVVLGGFLAPRPGEEEEDPEAGGARGQPLVSAAPIESPPSKQR